MNRNTYNAVFPKREFVWTTWDGVKKKISEIDHQHLSNIVHFMTYINPNYSHSIKFEMISELFLRFGGRLLPYRPIGTYKPEIEYLQQRGWLVPTEHESYYRIIINGKEVGEYTA